MAEKPYYLEELKGMFPKIVFETDWSLDPFPENWRAEWGERGDFQCYDVDFTATIIHNGEFRRGESSLGSCWYEPDHKDPEVGGYLLQKIEQALVDLRDQTSIPAMVLNECGVQSAINYIKKIQQAKVA